MDEFEQLALLEAVQLFSKGLVTQGSHWGQPGTGRDLTTAIQVTDGLSHTVQIVRRAQNGSHQGVCVGVGVRACVHACT